MTYLHHGVTYNQLEDLIDAVVVEEEQQSETELLDKILAEFGFKLVQE